MSEEIVNNKKSNGAYIAIIIILLVGIGALFFAWNNVQGELVDANNTVKKLDNDKKELNAVIAKYIGSDSKDLKANLNQMLANYDQLAEMGTPEQNAEIAQQKARIEELLSELDSNKKLNYYTISKLKRENDELRDIMRGYVYEIDSLNTLNLSLRNDLDETSTALEETTIDRDNLQVKADALDEKVKAGQKLTVIKSSFASRAMKQTITNNFKETNKAKNAVRVESEFTIGKNAITDAGEKTVYMQIVGPDKKTLQNTLSGIVETESGNVPYSHKRTIDYQNASVDMLMTYSVRSELGKGTYKVNIYCQGQLIGVDSFTLK
ncbi:hypothetical protein OAK35_03185 [Crocinitomicaceae bacterium]|nr:hypothetical protein [Crocinitomicaceae bacterium]MDC0257728.1 hypothetical protein [Crocinitomicaceae bacterium]